MKAIKQRVISLSYNERLSKATHFQQSTIQPNRSVHVGYEVGDCFQTLYIDMHKSEAKRKGLKESAKTFIL